jgi:hypothetical protein
VDCGCNRSTLYVFGVDEVRAALREGRKAKILLELERRSQKYLEFFFAKWENDESIDFIGERTGGQFEPYRLTLSSATPMPLMRLPTDVEFDLFRSGLPTVVGKTVLVTGLVAHPWDYMKASSPTYYLDINHRQLKFLSPRTREQRVATSFIAFASGAPLPVVGGRAALLASAEPEGRLLILQTVRNGSNYDQDYPSLYPRRHLIPSERTIHGFRKSTS